MADKMRKCIFIGGKQLGVNCLRQLLKQGIIPKLVIPNLDDMGVDTWHESLVKFATKKKLKVAKVKVTDPKVVKRILRINPEIIFSIGGMQIIPKEILKIPCLNIHPAMLPKYRGRYSTMHTIFNGDTTTGVTLHWINAGIDSGPIIMQKEIYIKDTDTAKTLYDKFTKVGGELFAIFFKKWIANERIVSTKQESKNATFYKKRLPNNGKLNWSWSGVEIYDFIRSMTFEPFPPVTFKIGKKKMVIVDEKYFKGFK